MIGSRSNRTLTLEGLIALVENDVELERQRKRNLCSSIRKFAGTVNGTLQLQATFPVFRDLIGKAEIAASGITRSRWRNVRSDVTFALRRHGAATRAPLRKDLCPEWAAIMKLFGGVGPKFRRGLSSFIHFCNSNAIAPIAVNDAAFDRFLDHLTHATMKNNPAKAHKQACKLWNECGEQFEPWPGSKVEVLSYRRIISFPWDEFPESFRNDLSDYVRFMGKDDPTGQHCVGSPRKPSTLAHHREQIHRWASALVRDGYDINGIIGLHVLVSAENFRRAVRYYHDEWLEGRKASLFEMASTMVVVAQEYVGVEGDDLGELKKIRNRLKCRTRGMTDKNRNRLRPLLSPENQVKFLCLTDKLMKMAVKNGPTHRSALMVQKALVHEILIHAPMRLGNLTTLNINRHFKRINTASRSQLFIVIPADEVKNHEMLEYELPEPTVRLFDSYIKYYRSLLLKGADKGWLFPGEVDGHKHQVTLRSQLIRIVEKHTGLQINPHLYRHIAAFFYLQANTGDYETVRRLLGHRSVETVMMFYAEFEGLAARRIYSQHILDRKYGLTIGEKDHAH